MEGEKPILCLDFDGVCHSYVSGWQGATTIADPPVAGLFPFLKRASVVFDVQIYSSRSHHEGGIAAMRNWFIQAYIMQYKGGVVPDFLYALTFPLEKPPAFVTLDDRALTFTGVWPTVATLRR